MFTNLISNAVKYSPNGGKVTINWQQTPEGIKVSVRDDGIGISKEMQAKVFDRFFVQAMLKQGHFPAWALDYILQEILWAGMVERSGYKANRVKVRYLFYFTSIINTPPKKITL